MTLFKKVDYARLSLWCDMSDDPCHNVSLLCGVVDAKRHDIDASLENGHSFSTSLQAIQGMNKDTKARQEKQQYFDVYSAEVVSMDSSTFFLRQKRKATIPLWLVSNKARQYRKQSRR